MRKVDLQTVVKAGKANILSSTKLKRGNLLYLALSLLYLALSLLYLALSIFSAEGVPLSTSMILQRGGRGKRGA